MSNTIPPIEHDMHFEHLVQVNDPLMPLLDPLTRTQLWNGLVRRAEDPLPFVLGLDACTILARRHNYLMRELRFGTLVYVDHVRLDPQEEVRYESDAAGDHAGSTLTMGIEEPSPRVLFVRFRYHTQPAQAGTAEDPQLENYRRSAYREADIHTVRCIRKYAAEGALG